jgi:hypothetical protein
MQQSDGLKASINGIVWYATALHLVTLAALLAAGMLFAVDDLATIKAVVSGLSIAIWGGAVLILLVVGVITLVRWLGQAPPADPLQDAWLDE